jgi:oxaloacetate decarboxylase gamma subunit
MENLEIGLMLMVIGMATVFAILLIVIYLGKGLIILVNKYAPEEVKKVQQTAQRTAPNALPNDVLAAIVAAVSVVSHGKGKVVKVEKL